MGKVGVVGGGLLAGLVVLGALVPAEEDNDVDAVSLPPVASATTELSVPTSLLVEPPATSDVQVTAAPVTEVPITTTAPTTTTVPTTTAAPQLMVSSVIDGDTIEMTDGSKIRLIGIDTPEQGECGYDESADTLSLILYGQSVTLVPGARDDVDRYGRLLRYLDLADGTDVNLAMINSGQAIARYDSRDGYGRHTREDSYVAADASSPAFCSMPVATTPPAPLPFVATAPPPPVQQPSGNVFYKNCDAVRAAGAAPIYAGDPGFQSKFDRDNDGVGCE